MAPHLGVGHQMDDLHQALAAQYFLEPWELQFLAKRDQLPLLHLYHPQDSLPWKERLLAAIQDGPQLGVATSVEASGDDSQMMHI